MQYYPEDNEPKQIDIMPKTPTTSDDIIGDIGKGIGKTGKAAFDMSLGLVADLLINPTELEAGFLFDLGKGVRGSLDEALKLMAKGTHIMPAKGGFTEVFEYSTKSMVNSLKKLAKENKGVFDDFLVDKVLKLDAEQLSKLPQKDKVTIAEKIYELKKSPEVQIVDDIADGTYGLHKPLVVEGQQGRTYVAKTVNGSSVKENEMIDTIIHEIQHGADSSNKHAMNYFTEEYIKKIPYDRDVSEMFANTAASRKTLPQEVIDKIHPLIGIGYEKFNLNPARKVVTSLLETGDMTIDNAKAYMKYMEVKLGETRNAVDKYKSYSDVLSKEAINTPISTRTKILAHNEPDMNINTTKEVFEDIIHYADTVGADGKEAVLAVKDAYWRAKMTGQVPSEQVRIKAHLKKKEKELSNEI